MYAAYQLSQVFLHVEFWIFLCLLAAGLLALGGRFLPSRRFLLLGIVLFYAVSIAPTAKALIGPLESRYPPFLSGGEQTYDAIVVLAGGVRWQPPFATYTILGTQSLDRLICGIHLLKQTSAPRMVFAGGVADAFVQTAPEAFVMRDQAVYLGVPAGVILTETHSRTTAESAAEIRRLLPGAQRIVLATSAYHLPRAVALFRKEGFAEIIAAPCSYEITNNYFGPGDLFPRLHNMELVNQAIHEYVGSAVYRTLGRL